MSLTKPLVRVVATGLLAAAALLQAGVQGSAAPAVGLTAPDPCATAVWVHRGDDPRAVVAAAGPGAVVCFEAVTFHLTLPIRPLAGQTLIGGGAVLDGSRTLHGFHKAINGWAVGGQRQQGQRNGVCRNGPACTYPDDVMRNNFWMQRVMRHEALRPGTYFFDYRHNTIYIDENPHGKKFVAMVAPSAILSRDGAAGSDVTVSGFSVHHFANPAQHGAIETTAPGWTIQGNSVQSNHGAGITTNGDARVVGNRVMRNGQLGIGGTGESTLVAHNYIAINNTDGFDPAWEAGGAKWALTDGLVVRRNHVNHNAGPGLWVDIDAQDTTFAHNTVVDNKRAGIFVEISAGATVTDNTILGNGFGFSSWLWGSGVLIAGSHDVEVSGNNVVGNAEGIGLVQQDRGVSTVDGQPRRLHDIAVHDNRTTMSGGMSGAVEDNGDTAIFTDPSITWTDDDWYQSTIAPLFAWDDDELSAEDWVALGHDVDGTFD